MKHLPIGINTLATIIEQDMVYVDKTRMAWHLINQPSRFFLSRPRRFGKSLFVDTLKEIFEGNQALFKELYIHDKWDWSQTYPVILIDFASGVLQTREELDQRIRQIMASNRERLGVAGATESDIPGLLENLILTSVKKYGRRAVVLIDEYDKPILDNIENVDTAAKMREGLKNFYSVLKGQDAHLQFVFMTGVTKFSKVSLFSGINQIMDITLNESFATICGYTPSDLQVYFADHLADVDMKKLEQWYNGYRWLGSTSVYNPFDILLFIRNNFSFRNYWFESGNPSFLIKMFRKNRYFLPSLEGLTVTEEILEAFDIESINPVTLLFQSGYLTVADTFTRRDRLMFRLTLPNQEVKIALNDHFINAYTHLVNEKIPLQDDLYTCLEQGDVAGMTRVIHRLFASIPWRNFTQNDLADYEGYYASVLYAFFSSLNATVIPEDITNHGQADLTVQLGSHIYIMEIKVVDADPGKDKQITGDPDTNPALAQIRRKKYADKYRGRAGIEVHEVGLVFSRKLRNLLS
ncbi:MAG: ATP-binding protein [Desulfotignum sp.]